MPRPGPRPYECVRRAWHSDRHQPMRGSIIQRIFRVVTEAHSSATRKNREWQEKLPRVVFKAEEIMYSKANSEAEYMDPETLWERLNDAIDTIIRRDESTETGQFLQPCIEAALVLGCVPVRASRSQRNSNPRSYLNPRFQESSPAAPVLPNNTNYYRPPPQPPNLSGSSFSMATSRMGNQAGTSSLPSSQMASSASYIATHTGPYTQPNFPRPMPSMAVDANSLNFGSVYPLYYDSHIPNVDPCFEFQSPQNSNPSKVIIGRPVGWRGMQPPCFSSTRNLLPGKSVETAAEKHEQIKLVDCHGKAAEVDCDLSLRLGPAQPVTSVEKRPGHLTSDGGSSTRQETSVHCEPCAKNLEFCFFPRQSGNDLSESCNNRLEQEGQVPYSNATLRKRKGPDHLELEDGRSQWLPEHQPNKFQGEHRWPGD